MILNNVGICDIVNEKWRLWYPLFDCIIQQGRVIFKEFMVNLFQEILDVFVFIEFEEDTLLILQNNKLHRLFLFPTWN